MTHYAFGGLVVESPFALPGLSEATPANGVVDIRVRLEQGAPPRGTVIHRWRGHYDLVLESLGDHWIMRHAEAMAIVISDRGRTLHCHGGDPERLALLGEIIARRVLPRVSVFFERFPIHAASLGDGQGATLLFGASGAGKSTMTAALAHRLGWSILADDMSVLANERRLEAYPTAPGVSVWPASQAGLALPPDACHPLTSYEGKVWFAPTSLGDLVPRPVKAVVLLAPAPGNRVRSERVFGPAVLVELARQLVVFNPRDGVYISSMMARLTRMIDRLPVHALSYPHDYRLLPLAIDSIRAIRDKVESGAVAAAP